MVKKFYKIGTRLSVEPKKLSILCRRDQKFIIRVKLDRFSKKNFFIVVLLQINYSDSSYTFKISMMEH
jgi:hypothetical protein